jgi:catechol 2,3-dioxygenase-like lactoylglutathione lyase family enzyme
MKKNKLSIFIFLISFLFFKSLISGEANKPMKIYGQFNIKANMIFFYYKDLDRAVEFYEKILGLPEVLDYGFAKAFQLSLTSYVCLVDETKGMHRASEPKTVTLSIITKEVDEWYQYLKKKGVKIHSPLSESSRLPIKGFVALDNEGYYLEFESFKEHEQNQKILAYLKNTPSLYPVEAEENIRPQELGIQGSIFWLYYQDLKEAQNFYETTLKLEFLVNQGFAQIYASSVSGFIGPVDGSRGLHPFTEKKAVNIGFITDQIEQWYEYLVDKGLKIKRPLDETVQGRVRAFVVFDTADYYFEFDCFNPHPDNQRLFLSFEKGH